MDLLPIVLIAFGLSMDAASISVVSGSSSKKINFLEGARIAFFFGLFQAIMPVIGWFLGVKLEEIIKNIDHWIAFILLAVIGVRMIYGSLKKQYEKNNISGYYDLILLSIATSIDALVVGVTLGLMDDSIFFSASIIGIITFIICLMAYLIGGKFGSVIGKKVEILGGIILIFIGLKIFIEHLFYIK